MLHITIKSYDEHFDTFECAFQDHLSDACFDSLIPATLVPYIAPELCNACDNLPYDCVGREFTLQLPSALFQS